jgi:ParB family chromosome partitioning protein
VTAREPGPRLGRGLAALLGDAAGASDRNTSVTAEGEGIRILPIDVLEAGPYQPRQQIDPGSLDELVASIRARGILQPLLARPHPLEPGRYQIVAGERRWRAAQSAGLREIPVLVRPLTDPEAMAAALVENLQRKDLNPIEEAEGYRRLLDEFAMTQEMLGEAVGKSRSHIANTLRLLNLPERVQIEVRRGGLSAGHARALLAHKDPEKAALQVIARGLNVRQTEALAGRGNDEVPQRHGNGRHKDPDTAILERTLTARLGLRVEIMTRGTGGTLRLHYRTLDQLESVIALLTRD